MSCLAGTSWNCIGAAFDASRRAAQQLGARSGSTPAKWEREMHRRGLQTGWYVLAAGVMAGIALLLLEAESFWGSNALYAALVLAEIAAGTVRIVLYRRRAAAPPVPVSP